MMSDAYDSPPPRTSGTATSGRVRAPPPLGGVRVCPGEITHPPPPSGTLQAIQELRALATPPTPSTHPSPLTSPPPPAPADGAGPAAPYADSRRGLETMFQGVWFRVYGRWFWVCRVSQPFTPSSWTSGSSSRQATRHTRRCRSASWPARRPRPSDLPSLIPSTARSHPAPNQTLADPPLVCRLNPSPSTP